MRLRIAGTVFQLEHNAPDLARAAEGILEGTATTEAADWTIYFARADGLGEPSLDMTLDTAATATGLRASSDGRFIGDFDVTTKIGRFAVARGESAAVSLRNIVRYALVLDCQTRGGIALHAASCAFEGKGYAFFGRSGAGKSTLSRAFRPVDFLGDELCFIADAPPKIFRSPFYGEVPAPPGEASAPLAALLSLEQAPAFCCEPLSPAEAVRRLLATTLHLSLDAQSTRLLTDRVVAMAAAFPVWRFAVPKLSSEQMQAHLAALAQSLASAASGA